MKRLALLKKAAGDSGCTEYGMIQTAELRFYPEIRKICEDNTCRGYSKTWACSPAVGTLEEYRNCLAESVKLLLPGALILSNEGCGRCKTCTYPDASCRFPDKLYTSAVVF